MENKEPKIQFFVNWPFLTGYIVIEPIGKGSFGSVFKAMDKRAKRYVAIKKIKSNQNGIPATAIRELSILKELKHPNIIVYEGNVLKRGVLYLILKFYKWI